MASDNFSERLNNLEQGIEEIRAQLDALEELLNNEIDILQSQINNLRS